MRRKKVKLLADGLGSRGPFLEGPKMFLHKAVSKSLKSSFIYTFLLWPEVPLMQDVSGACTFPFLDRD